MFSRLERFLHSVASGYAVMAAHTVVGLVTVPVVLAYLPRREFGLWALVSQIAIYLGMLDAGLSTSVSRLLTDARQKNDPAEYARFVKTCWAAQLLQGAAAFAIGVILLIPAAGLFGVDPDLGPSFRILLFWQAVLVGLGFLARLADLLLYSNQRQFVSNYAQIAGTGVSLAVTVLGLRAGWGLYSLPAAALAAWGTVTVVRVWACFRLRLWPAGFAAAAIRLAGLREAVALGKDMFLVALGSQLILSSQVIILARTQGTDSAAVWAVATRVGFMLAQVAWMFFDQSLPALYEMMAQNDRGRLERRFRELAVLSSCMGAVIAVLFVFCNAPLLQVWTRGIIAWPDRNDLWFGGWLFALAVFHPHIMFVIVTKRIGFMKWVYLLEGTASVLVSLLVVPSWGIGGMLACFLASSLVFHGPYGLRRTRREFGLSWRQIGAQWHGPAIAILLVLAGVGLALRACLDPATGAGFRLAAFSAAILLPGAGLLFRFGLAPDWRDMAVRRALSLVREGRER